MPYWDTSCLLKLYAPEPDSTTFKTHILAGGNVVTSEIARLEMHAALQRKESAGAFHIGGGWQALAAYDADVAARLIITKPIGRVVVEEFEAIVEQCYHQSPPLLLR